MLDEVSPTRSEKSKAASDRHSIFGATDLIVSLASDGRTARLFTADGESPSEPSFPSAALRGRLESDTEPQQQKVDRAR